jgi:hypothetical protein
VLQPPIPANPWTTDPGRLILRTQLEGQVSPKAARIYEAAIAALNPDANPERHAISCYLMRELIDEIPKAKINRSIDPMTAGSVVGWVETEWGRFAGDPARIKRDGGWRHWPWEPLAKFLRSIGEKLKIYRADFPQKRDLRFQALLLIDPGLAALDDKARLSFMKALEGYEGHFNAVLHHSKDDPAATEAQIADFEQYLGRILNPPVFANRARIAQLIARAEGRADS